MAANDYLRANSAWRAAVEATSIREGGDWREPPAATAAVKRASDAEDVALNSIIETPTTSLDEIAARAAILSSLISDEAEGLRADLWPTLCARIAVDLQNLAASTAASSGTDAPTSASEAIRCAA